MSEFWFYFTQGLFHVLDWNAYDHILFLIVLTVSHSYQHWKKIILLVTLFTVGHTMSLLLEFYKVVTVNASLIELLIPITIFITAWINIFTLKKTKSILSYTTTIFFGLIHGFGFSGYFKMIGNQAENKLWALFEFSLGIELSQVIVVLIVLILGFIIQTIFRISQRDWILVMSSIVIGIIIPMIIHSDFW